jgi:hypothetical protein
MLRYRLRTLLIVLALGPPLLAGAWWAIAPSLGYPLLVNALVVLWLSMVVGLGAVAWLMTISRPLPPAITKRQ